MPRNGEVGGGLGTITRKTVVVLQKSVSIIAWRIVRVGKRTLILTLSSALHSLLSMVTGVSALMGTILCVFVSYSVPTVTRRIQSPEDMVSFGLCLLGE